MAKTGRRVRVPVAPPQVANPEAVEIATRAAEAAGLSIQGLADLLLDNALAIRKDGESMLVERYTLEDLGQHLWLMMQQSPRSERGDWFHKLSDPQKAAIITVLKHRGFASHTIAQDFNVAIDKVDETWNAYSSQLGAQVLGLRLDTIAGQLQSSFDRAKEMAMRAGDHKAMWKFEADRIKLLQSLGIVDRAIHRVEVTHKMSDEQQAELDQLLKLEVMKSTRAGQIKVIEDKKAAGDALPPEVDRDLDEGLEDDDERG